MSEPHRVDAFTDRELALLKAWDESDAPVSDAAFEARLLAAHTRAEAAALHADEARDAAVCRQLAANADLDGTAAVGAAAVPLEEAVRDDVQARRCARGLAWGAVAAAMVAAGLWRFVLWRRL
jgi:hypothetical protein